MVDQRLAVASLLLLGALTQGSCGAARSPPALASSACDARHLDACERRLAFEEPTRDLVAAYVAARAVRDPSDPWSLLFRALSEATRAAVLVEPGASAPTAAARVIPVAELPPTGALDPVDLMLAMGAAAGLDVIAHLRADSTRLIFPSDPLAPFTGGLRPVIQGKPVLALDADLAVASSIRAAFEAAAAFRYVDAAREAERLALLADTTGAGSALRARHALQLLGAAGLVLDAEPPRPAAPATAPSSQTDTPYTAYLRVVAARDTRREWEAHGARVLPGFPADRRAAVARLFARARACDMLGPPPMESARDLVFASRLAGASSLPPADWLARYDAMLRFVESTHTAWSYLPTLVYQRGDTAGLSPANSASYRRVTELGLAHLAGQKALEEAYPTRYRAHTQLGLAMSPGLLADDKLRAALVKLTEASVQDKLAAATDADAVLSAVATGALAGLSYPPALQEAHLAALAGAVTAKLEGDFSTKTGWGVAALYAADAAYRLATDVGKDPSFASAQIARALKAPGVPHPALAVLATAGARYAALAAAHELSVTTTRLSAERLAARAELRAALAGLGADGEAPGELLDDITELADCLVAAVSTALAAAPARKPAACTEEPALPLDPLTRRALARLGDVRGRILAHPRYRQGDGVWARRARLLVTLLSDGMDLAVASDARKAPVFAVSATDARKAVEGALVEVEPRALGEAASAGYAVARRLSERPSSEAFVKQGGPEIARLVRALSALHRTDALDGEGPTLLEVLAGVRWSGELGDDLSGSLVAYAGALYDEQETDKADLCLLAALLIASVTRTPPPEKALELAAGHQSRVSWALRFVKEVHGSSAPDPSAYADAMRGATDDACQAPDADTTLAVMQAVHDFVAGERKEARAALDAVLERADDKGLGVPRMAYEYHEKTATKVFSVSLDISYGRGLLRDGNDLRLGLGVRTAGEPGGSLTATLSPSDTPKAGEDAARYYVLTASLATVYHLIEGDTERGMAAGGRVVSALANGLKLGPRRLRSEHPEAWGKDAAEALIIAAELAAEAGMPLFAGDLWTVVKAGFAETLDDKQVSAMLQELPIGLADIPEVKAAAARARRSLKVLAAPLPCTAEKVELGGYEEPACEVYPLALSLRVADVLRKLPRLRRDQRARCGPLGSLDGFFGGVDKGTYDPDAFTRAVRELQADGKLYDAAVLLARQKRAHHCSAWLVSQARTLGRSRLLSPSMRADLLAGALSCTAATAGPEVDEDVDALDEETRRLPDPSRSLSVLLWVAELSLRTNRWETLGKLTDKPDLVGRWMSIHPDVATAALLLDHASAVLRGQAVATARTKGAHELLCESFRTPQRAELCGAIGALRAPATGPSGEKPRVAREALKKLLASAASKKP